MSKTRVHSSSFPSFYRDKSFFFVAITTTIVFLCLLWSASTNSWPEISTFFAQKTSFEDCTNSASKSRFDRNFDPQEKTFYDDPNFSYTIGKRKPIKNWDEKRRKWLNLHPSFLPGVQNRVLLLTGSQSLPCKNPFGDHLLLRAFKNKVDYCRIHGHDIFYSNVHLNPKMKSFWTKIPLVKASMLAHPETEWIWWMDSDAIFTDMDFKVPLQRYKHHNFVVHGWPNLIYEKKSWVAVNAGIFLIRNCQWSLDFLDAWAKMGPQSEDYKHWGEIQRSIFKDKLFPDSDDQSALVYLLLKEKKKWGHMMYVENQYALHGYWVGIVGNLENIEKKYLEDEKKLPILRRRRAEVASEAYGKLRGRYLEESDVDSDSGSDEKSSLRRPFITHFTGCQPCSGVYNPSYEGNSCWDGMEKALNFADNQVLRNFGFVHKNLGNSSSVFPLWYNFPANDESEESV